MKSYKIYTAGKMKGLTFQDQMYWRMQLEDFIFDKIFDTRIKFIHPPMFYNYEEENQHSEAEIKEWELNQLIGSDILVVNLEGVNNSVGTHYELGVADAMNMFGKKHIYIVGFGSQEGLHPWIVESLFRREDDLEKVADYISDYLLL